MPERARLLQPRQRLRPARRPRPRHRRLHASHQARCHRPRRVQQPRPGLRRTRASTTLAIADYTESIRLKRNNPGAFFNRGSAYEQLGEHDRAIADYTRGDQARRHRSRGVQQPRAGLRRPRATTIWRLPTTPSRSASAATTPAPSSTAAWPMPTRTTTRRAVADFNEAIRLDPQGCRRLPEPRRHARGARQRGRRARRLSQRRWRSARARGRQGGAWRGSATESRAPLPHACRARAHPTRNGRSVGSGRRIP